MPQLLELEDREFKIMVISMLSSLLEKVDSMQKQMGKVSREMEIIRNNEKKMLEIYSDRDKEYLVPLSGDLTQLRMKISKVDRPIESSQTKKQREKKK